MRPRASKFPAAQAPQLELSEQWWGLSNDRAWVCLGVNAWRRSSIARLRAYAAIIVATI